MQSQAFNRGSLVAVAIALLAVVSLSQMLFKGWRLDLTENQLYTLSDGTKNVLDKIEEPVTLYFFYNRDAASEVPQLQAYATRVQEFLEELALYAGDGLRLELIAPEPFSTEEDRAVELGLQGLPLNDAGDSFYFGLAGSNTVDDVETIPFFQPNREGLLEYDVTKLVYSLANPDKPKVGVLSQLDVYGGFDPQQMQATPPWMALRQLDEFFDVSKIEPTTDSISEEIEVLVLIHPADLPEATLYAIDQFVMRGGRLLAFVDPYAETAAPRQMETMGSGASPNSNLEPLLSHWGVKLAADVLGDGSAALQVSGQTGQAVFHLGLLGFDGRNLAADDVVTQGLESINMGYTGFLLPQEEASTRFTPLLQSSDRSAGIPAYKIQPNLNPVNLQKDFSPTGEAYAVAGRLQGPVSSAFGDAPPEGVENPEHLSESTQELQAIIIADTDLLSDRFWVQVQNFMGQTLASPFAGNGDLLVNAVDNLLGSSDLIGIKSRAGYARPFTRIEDMERQADAEFRKHEQRLQAKLQETEAKLSELQAQRGDGSALSLSPEQEAEIERFRDEQLATRKELREVRHSLNKDIDALETWLKFVNIGLIPLLIILGASLFGLKRRWSAH